MAANTASFTLRRLAITGAGLVTPLGINQESTWKRLVAGHSAVDWIDPKFLGTSGNSFRSRPFGAQVPWPGLQGERMVSFARQATREAVQQSNCSPELLRQAGCVIGTSKIDLKQFDQWARIPESTADFDLLFPSQVASTIAREFGCERISLAPVAACATGLVAIIQAANLIRSGECPIAIAGGTDASLHAGLLSSYKRLGVLANPQGDPATACRPFDKTRSGFAVGEGAGILILEDWDHACRRNAPILAEWVDGVIGSEPAGLTRIEPDGEVLSEVIRRLLIRASHTAETVDGISLHATATLLNDEAEGAAIQKVFQRRPSPVPAFGVKGAIGHLMGAAGAVETALCVLSLHHQRLPPTVNYREPDDHQHTGYAITRTEDDPGDRSPGGPLDTLLKVSMGFGGTIAAGLLKRAVPTE